MTITIFFPHKKQFKRVVNVLSWLKERGLRTKDNYVYQSVRAYSIRVTLRPGDQLTSVGEVFHYLARHFDAIYRTESTVTVWAVGPCICPRLQEFRRRGMISHELYTMCSGVIKNFMDDARVTEWPYLYPQLDSANIIYARNRSAVCNVLARKNGWTGDDVV